MAVIVKHVSAAAELTEIFQLRTRLLGTEPNAWPDVVDKAGVSQQFAAYDDEVLLGAARLTCRAASVFPGRDSYLWRQAASELQIPSDEAAARCYLFDRFVVDPQFINLHIGSLLLTTLVDAVPNGSFLIGGTKRNAHKIMTKLGWIEVKDDAKEQDKYRQYYFFKGQT